MNLKNLSVPDAGELKNRWTRLFAKHKLPLILAAVIVVAAIVIAVIIGGQPTMIDPAAYTDVRFEGYDGTGSAYIQFDENAYLYDVATAMAKKRIISRKIMKDLTPETLSSQINSNWEDGAKITLAGDTLQCQLDRKQDLSNGDTVTATFQYNNAEAEKYGIRFQGKEKSFTVDGLSQLATFDAFAGLDVTITGPDGYGQVYLTKTGTEDYFTQLDFDVDHSGELHNGDTITVSVTNRVGENDFSDFAKTYGTIPAETTRNYTVEGLTETETFDAFADLSFTLEGVEPFGTILVVNEDEENGIWFETDRYDGLSNGDRVTVWARSAYGPTFDQTYADIFGQVPEATERILEIAGLPTYLKSLDDLSQEQLVPILKMAEDSLNDYVDTNWYPGYDNLKSMAFTGQKYLLSAKDDEYTWLQDQLFLLYEIQVEAVNGAESTEETFYTYVRFSNVVKNTDGTITADPEMADLPMAVCDPGGVGHYYAGYDSLDQLVADMITSQEGSYVIESDSSRSDETETEETDGAENTAGEITTEETAGAQAPDAASGEQTQDTASEEQTPETAEGGDTAGGTAGEPALEAVGVGEDA